MKLTFRIAQLLLGAGAALTLTAACGDNSDADVDSDLGGGGEGNTATCDIPGGRECTASASGLVCPPGGGAAVEFTCASGEICDDGECQGQCTAGDTECVGGSVQRVCTADGRSWVEIPCQEGLICEDGACGRADGLECTPGATECNGEGTLRTCQNDGTWDDEECPGQTACSDGACRGTVCAVGATKCDESTLNLPLALFSEGSEPNFYVVYTCTDGEHWESSPCPEGDDDYDSICTYSGVDQGVANAYRTQVNSWLVQFFNASSNDLPLPVPPPTPTLPADAKAACAVPDCDWESAFFESPASSRYCGTSEGDGDDWTSFTQCEGMAPYGNLKEQNYECTGQSACTPYSGGYQGCVPVECFPGERVCSGATSYQECDNYYFQFMEGASCPGGVPGACAETGNSPERDVTCGGQAIPEPVK